MGAEIIRVIVADHGLDRARNLADSLEKASERIKVMATASSGFDLVDKASRMGPDAAVCEFSMPDMDGLQIAQKLGEECAGVQLFLLTGAFSVDLVRRAQAAGAAGLFRNDERLSPRDLASQIEAEVDEFRERLAEAGSEPAGRKRAEEPRGFQVTGVRQRVTAVYSPKGGVGKTLISSNLAVAVRRSPVLKGLSVAYLDFDEWGAGAFVFGLGGGKGRSPMERNLLNALRLDEATATRDDVEDMFLIASSGLHVLAAPPNPMRAAKATMDLAHKVLRLTRRYYDVCVIDCGPKYADVMNAVLEHATEMLIVVNPEPLSNENIIDLHRVLRQGDSDVTASLEKKFRLVVNKVGEHEYQVSEREISDAVGMPVYRSIPYDPHAPAALTRYNGKTAVEVFPDAPFSVRIKQLAHDLYGAYPGIEREVKRIAGVMVKAGTQAKPSFLARLFGLGGKA